MSNIVDPAPKRGIRSMTAYPISVVEHVGSNQPHRARRVYLIEFAEGVVKVGVSADPASRIKTLVGDGRRAGYSPTRFALSPVWSNAIKVEKQVIRELLALSDSRSVLGGTRPDFPSRSEWITNATLEDALLLLTDYVSVENPYGHIVAVSQADLDVIEAANASASAEVPA